MIINRSNINDIFLNIKKDFELGYSSAQGGWEKIATLIPSMGTENKYTWMSKFPRMRQWVGEKAFRSLSASSYTITNYPYEATIEIDRYDIEDDNIGQIKPAAQDAGYAAKTWPDELVFGLVNNAFTNECFDGKAFCATDHTVGDTTVSNKGTTAFSVSSYGAARTAMRQFKDEEGRPLGIIPDVLLVPPALEDGANILMMNDRLEDGKPNPYKGTATVMVGDWLTDDNNWFLLCTKRPIKPFIFQQREAPRFVAQTDINSDNVFNYHTYRFGVESRGNAGYSFWQLCYGSEVT